MQNENMGSEAELWNAQWMVSDLTDQNEDY